MRNAESFELWLKTKEQSITKDGWNYWLERFTIQSMQHIGNLNDQELDRLYDRTLEMDLSINEIKNFLNGCPV